MNENELEQITQPLLQVADLLAKSIVNTDLANLRLNQMTDQYERLAQQNEALIGLHRLLLQQLLYELVSRQIDPVETARKFRDRVITMIEKHFGKTSPQLQELTAKAGDFFAEVEAIFRHPAGDVEWPSFLDE